MQQPVVDLIEGLHLLIPMTSTRGHASTDFTSVEALPARHQSAARKNYKMKDAAKIFGDGLSALRNNEIKKAEKKFRKITDFNGGNFAALDLLAACLMVQERWSEAEPYCKSAMQLNPHSDATLSNYGLILKQLSRPSESLDAFTRALDLNSRNPVTWHNRGTVLCDKLGRYADAISDFERAFALDSTFTDPLCSKGKCLVMLRRHHDAIAAYDAALAIKPDLTEAWLGRGNALFAQKQDEEALVCFEKAIQCKPDHAEAYFAKSLLLLSRGEYELGWKLYEWRWKCGNFNSRRRNFSRPLWLNNFSVQKKTLLIHAEQGFGDTLQWSRYVVLLQERCHKLIFEVPPSLFSLFSAQPWDCEIVECGKKLPHFDAHCPTASLPLVFGTTAKTIPRNVPYLRAPPDAVENWSKKLGTREPGKARIGLMWSGNQNFANLMHRRISLQQMVSSLQGNFEFHALQKEIAAEEDQFLREAQIIRNHSKELTSFADTAALIENLDLIISIDTSVAHLAGAMGKPVWILLPYHADFRWLREGFENPWYPTAVLYRQSEDGDWTSVLQQVALALRG